MGGQFNPENRSLILESSNKPLLPTPPITGLSPEQIILRLKYGGDETARKVVAGDIFNLDTTTMTVEEIIKELGGKPSGLSIRERSMNMWSFMKSIFSISPQVTARANQMRKAMNSTGFML